MRTIRSEAIAYILSIVIPLVGYFGWTDVYRVSQAETFFAQNTMTRLCLNSGYQLERTLTRAEDTVRFLARAATNHIPNLEALSYRDYRNTIKDHLIDSFSDAVRSIDGIETFYVHFSEKIVPGKESFWYVRNHQTGRFEVHEPTDVESIGEKDLSRTGWYYIPAKTGKPMWLPPYTNGNLGTKMISYVLPLFVEGEFAAIVGVDLNWSLITDTVRSIKVLSTGYAYLSGSQDELFYHPDFPNGTKNAPYYVEPRDNSELMVEYGADSARSPLAEANYFGKRFELAFYKLPNEMHLVTAAPKAEIYAGRTHAITRAVTIAVGALLLSFLLAYRAARNLTRPIEHLTSVTREIGQGNYDIVAKKFSKNELGQLTDSINEMIVKLKQYSETIEGMAYLDSLTGVKNARAYDEKMSSLQARLQNGFTDFGILIIDLNRLKEVNDQFGHDKGNIAIRSLTSFICNIFKHSPVFRIGGDEFAVTLEGFDLERIDELLEQTRPHRIARDLSQKEPWTQVVFSLGFARYDPSLDESCEDVVRRADAIMFAEKKSLGCERQS